MKLNDFSLNTLISLTSGEAPPTKKVSSRCTSTAQVRLLRFWEDRNVKSDTRGSTFSSWTPRPLSPKPP
ncbi:unnamed protein product [Brassica napus]|uniref:(rape) hypothetical protein n=1 Tax=Brassica napus TaxID=3708 RepID=A0A816YSS4_BRANA|nr:unnamed protein product [Brassica napus]